MADIASQNDPLSRAKLIINSLFKEAPDLNSMLDQVAEPEQEGLLRAVDTLDGDIVEVQELA